MNSDRRKHIAPQCAWGSAIPKIETTLKHLVETIEKDSQHRSETDGEQFKILREHTGEIGKLKGGLAGLEKRVSNSKHPNPDPVAACPDPSLWQVICKIKKTWFLFLFVGGATLLTLFADILINIAIWLKQFASTL